MALVARKGFREALARSEQEVAARPDDVVVAGARYRVLDRIAVGERADVLLATRARRLGERVVLKVLRSPGPSVNREWDVLAALHASEAQGSGHFTVRLPVLVTRGEVHQDGGARPALVVRASPGFRLTLAGARDAFPAGLDPRHAVWIWRRLLELLGWVHRSGWAHGAVEPTHVVLNEHEHGAMLVSWSRAMRVAGGGDPAADLTMAARAIGATLGDDAAPAVRELVDACAAGQSPTTDAWRLKELVAEAARRAFGPPTFVPFVLPGPPNHPRRR
jgi:hypothetical protein